MRRKRERQQGGDERDSTFTSVKHPEWSRNDRLCATQRPWRRHPLDDACPSNQQERPQRHSRQLLCRGRLQGFQPRVRHYRPVQRDGEEGTRQGMKVILDWVPNHSGRDNKWITEHPDWYEKDSRQHGRRLRLDRRVCVRLFKPGDAQGMIDAMKFWLTDVDVDGFRCDVAGEVPTDFWDEAVRSLRPQSRRVHARGGKQAGAP